MLPVTKSHVSKKSELILSMLCIIFYKKEGAVILFTVSAPRLPGELPHRPGESAKKLHSNTEKLYEVSTHTPKDTAARTTKPSD